MTEIPGEKLSKIPKSQTPMFPSSQENYYAVLCIDASCMVAIGKIKRSAPINLQFVWKNKDAKFQITFAFEGIKWIRTILTILETEAWINIP